VPRDLRNWKLGFALAMTTAVLWGFLPIALKVALEEVDAWTITWCRFAGAWLTVGVWLASQRTLPFGRLREGKIWRWLLPGCLGMTINYTLYVLGLRYTSAAVTQVVMQIAPPMLLLMGMFFFKERFSGVQWLGFATLLIGLAVFFNRRLPELSSPGEGFSFGILLLVLSSISWAIYGLSQKTLSRQLTSAQILFLMYGGATVLLLPAANFSLVLNAHRPALIALLFGIVNTVAAYGAFGLALEVWDVSRVSSVVCAAPLFTVVGSLIASRAAIPWVVPETLNTLSIVGACAVVGGSMISALGGRK
jgi:drug/metabolite transporter (DMT)-like permease